MKRFLTGAALLPLVMACGAARPANKAVAATDSTKPAGATYALGTSLTNDGAIAADSAGDSFRRGPEIYLAIDTASASIDQMIEVQWVDAAGRIARRDAHVVPEGTKYARFATGDTTTWQPGAYRAVISINNRFVNQTPFTLT